MKIWGLKAPLPLWDRYSRGEFYPAIDLFVLWNRIWRFSRENNRDRKRAAPITLPNTIHFSNCINKMQRRGEVFPLLFPISDSLLLSAHWTRIPLILLTASTTEASKCRKKIQFPSQIQEKNISIAHGSTSRARKSRGMVWHIQTLIPHKKSPETIKMLCQFGPPRLFADSSTLLYQILPLFPQAAARCNDRLHIADYKVGMAARA